MEHFPLLGGFFSALAIYVVATISPGPANLAIMTTAIQSGRKAGLWLAGGVINGSMIWGILAASGLSFLIVSYSEISGGIMLCGGLYLGYISYRNFRSFRLTRKGVAIPLKLSVWGERNVYLQGLAIHLTNPKSVLAWAATISIVITPDSTPLLPYLMFVTCWLTGVAIFCGYALIFSTEPITLFYQKHGAWVSLCSGILFLLFGLQLVVRGYIVLITGI